MAYGIKICLGCGARGRWTSSGRCGPCEKLHKAKYAEPGYIAARARFQDLLRAGCLLDCIRCGQPIRSVDDLDTEHHYGDYEPGHRACNRGNGR